MTATNGVKAAGRKVPILSLPLVPRSSRLTECLLPDPLTPTPAALLSVSTSSPSLLRRSRNVGEGSHFSYLTPLVLEFPYDLKAIESIQDGAQEQSAEELQEEKRKVEAMNEEERMEYGMQRARKEMDKVEALMRPYEIAPENDGGTTDEQHLRAYLPKARKDQSYPSARLLGVSTECVDDCLPQLDLGDSLGWIKTHAGRDGPDCYSSGPIVEIAQGKSTSDAGGDASQARIQLSDYLSGRLIGALMPTNSDLKDVSFDAEPGVGQAQQGRVARSADPETRQQRWQRRQELLVNRQSDKQPYGGYAPWANAYSGHQFGQWAGQLGDGRATTLMETFNEQTGQRWEIQLKGAGRTPYSRFADGLAALFSSVREYLASEAMHGLGIPTSRALALLSVKDVTVVREHRHPAAVCARLAPIWTRVGSFEHHATREEWESVRLLGEFVCREGYGWKAEAEEGAPWAERLIRECARRNAEMIAQWQTYGFMHGVMNTDNISLLGITIDYGPYGFMDIFERSTICNKSDGEGRYAFHMQPTAALFVMQQLTSSLAFLVGFERKHGRAAKPGELVAMDEQTVKELGRSTSEDLWTSVKEYFMDTLISQWLQAWRKRLALTSSADTDRAELVDPLLDLLDGYLDFTQSLRRLHTLSTFVDRSGDKDDVDGFVDQWLDWERVPSFVRDQRRGDAVKWAKRYIERLRKDHVSFKDLSNDLKAVNPTFTLRNWVTDEVNERLRTKDDTDFLQRILHMALHPFDAWGEETQGKSAADLEEEKRLCSVGTLLTTNMPSCSS